MKRKIGSSVLFVSALTAIAFGAPAGALNSATNVASRSSVPVPTAPALAAQGAVATAAVARPVAGNPAVVATDTRIQAASAVPVPLSPGVNATATTHAAVAGQANGLAVAQSASNRTSIAVDVTETAKSIREASLAKRDSIIAHVQDRLDASGRLMSELQAKAEAKGENVRAMFGAAAAKVREQEKQVRASLKAAGQATSAASWAEAQSALARDYEAYAQAAAQAEAIAPGPDEAANPAKG